MAKPGLTLEVWLGEATDPDVTIDYGTSSLYDKARILCHHGPDLLGDL